VTLAQFAPLTDRLLDVVQIAVMAGFLAVAWFAGRPVAHGNPDAVRHPLTLLREAIDTLRRAVHH
jgi:hypothetical protein